MVALEVALAQGGLGALGSQFCAGASGMLLLGPARVLKPPPGPHQPKPRRSERCPWINSESISVLLVPSVMTVSLVPRLGEKGAPPKTAVLPPLTTEEGW